MEISGPLEVYDIPLDTKKFLLESRTLEEHLKSTFEVVAKRRKRG